MFVTVAIPRERQEENIRYAIGFKLLRDSIRRWVLRVVYVDMLYFSRINISEGAARGGGVALVCKFRLWPCQYVVILRKLDGE